MDLMFRDGNAVLHIVDTAAHFSAACLLEHVGENFGQCVEGIWMAFLTIWCTMYTGYPNRMRTNKGSVFTSEGWKQLTDLSGTQLRLSGVSQFSWDWETLSCSSSKNLRNDQVFFTKLSFNIAVQAMNDTMDKKNLDSTRLVFGIIPILPTKSTNLPAQKIIMEVIKLHNQKLMH